MVQMGTGKGLAQRGATTAPGCPAPVAGGPGDVAGDHGDGQGEEPGLCCASATVVYQR